jgi:hypothetical protein
MRTASVSTLKKPLVDQAHLPRPAVPPIVRFQPFEPTTSVRWISSSISGSFSSHASDDEGEPARSECRWAELACDEGEYEANDDSESAVEKRAEGECDGWPLLLSSGWTECELGTDACEYVYGPGSRVKATSEGGAGGLRRRSPGQLMPTHTRRARRPPRPIMKGRAALDRVLTEESKRRRRERERWKGRD